MMTRADDGDEKVRQHRLEVYARESKPLLDYYRGRADISLDQRRAGAGSRGEGAGGEHRRDGAGCASGAGGAMIVCRSAAELRRLREVNQLVGHVLEQLREAVAPGVTTAGARRACRARDSRGRRGTGVQGLQRLSRDDLRVGERAGRSRDPVHEDGAERGRHHLDRPRRARWAGFSAILRSRWASAGFRRRRPICCG